MKCKVFLTILFCVEVTEHLNITKRSNQLLEINFDSDAIAVNEHQDRETDIRPSFREIIDMTGSALLSLQFYPLSCAIPQKICYDEFGCYHNQKGPLKYMCRLPQPPEKLGTEFRLFVKGKKEAEIHYEESHSWDYVPFGSRVVFVIHGNGENSDFPIIYMMKDAFLERTNYNVVILVDYFRSHALGDGLQSLVNMQVIGIEVALLADKLRKHRGIDPRDLYYNCFSAGCVLAHFAAKSSKLTFGYKVGRVTAIESPSILIEKYPDVTVSKEDALFVDTIHTTGGFDERFSVTGSLLGYFGATRPYGHVDFYVNGGRMQPNCYVRILPWCSHVTARRYFIFSMTVFIGRESVSRLIYTTPTIRVKNPTLGPNRPQGWDFTVFLNREEVYRRLPQQIWWSLTVNLQTQFQIN